MESNLKEVKISKKFKISSAALVAAFAATSFISPAFASTLDVSSNISSLVIYLESQQEASGKIAGFGGETSWTIMGLAAVGIDPSTVENSGNSLLDFLAVNPPADAATTGWERDLLAITAAGENPFTFGGRNYVAKVQSFANAGQIGSITTLNDDIFGILSLVSAGPSANQTIISESVDFLIANQNSDGGWSWQVGGASDTNDTAVAIQALRSAANSGFTNTGLNDVIDSSVNYLLGLQQSDGGWEYQPGFGTDGASTAWVVQALVGNDTAVTNGLNFLTGLQDASGGVQYQAGFGADTFTSGYALNAFAQKSFPVGSFEGEFSEEPEQPPVDGRDDQEEEASQPSAPSDEDGKVLAAITKEDGQVLATVLPATGIDSAIPVSDKTIAEVSTTQSRTLDLTFIIGVSLILAGIILNYVSRRYLKIM